MSTAADCLYYYHHYYSLDPSFLNCQKEAGLDRSKCKANFLEITRSFFFFILPHLQWEQLFIYCKLSQQDTGESFQSAIILLWIIFNLWWYHYAKIIATINIHMVNMTIKASAYTLNQYLPLLSNPCVNSCPTITPIAP